MGLQQDEMQRSRSVLIWNAACQWACSRTRYVLSWKIQSEHRILDFKEHIIILIKQSSVRSAVFFRQ